MTSPFREKLGSGLGVKEPILLPPRDYDTMNRSRGNIFGVDERRSLNPAVVGQAGEVWTGLDGSSGNSSGIGSQSPSPVQEHRETSGIEKLKVVAIL